MNHEDHLSSPSDFSQPRRSASSPSRVDGLFYDVQGLDQGEIRKAQRIEQVRSIWKSLVDEMFLKHTNAVYIFTKDDRKQMHVYVDESIYAAELNARRELIKLECRQRFGEVIDDFEIHISRGKRKLEHPFIDDNENRVDGNDPIPLSLQELKQVEDACNGIPDDTVRLHFKKAMIADLEWKKGNKR